MVVIRGSGQWAVAVAVVSVSKQRPVAVISGSGRWSVVVISDQWQ